MAIGPQIYVDGLVVLDGQEPVGRIGSQHIIQYILQHRDRWFHAAASQIMNQPPTAVEASDPLVTALDIFRKTKFAFVPITIDDRLATSLSIRDVLRLADRLVTPVGELSSQSVSVKYGTSLEKALELMLEKGIRNLVVRTENNNTRIINDRKILEFLLSFEGRRIIASPMGLDAVSLELLDPPFPKCIKRSMSAAIAAQFLSDINTPCLLCDDSIVTPWDVVIKGLLKA